MMKVAVFKPHGKFNIYTMKICESNLAYLHLQGLETDDQSLEKSLPASFYSKKILSEENEDDELEEVWEPKGDEFYNIFEIFMDSGIVPKIKMDKNLLKEKNRETVNKLTGGWMVSRPSYLIFLICSD